MGVAKGAVSVKLPISGATASQAEAVDGAAMQMPQQQESEALSWSSSAPVSEQASPGEAARSACATCGCEIP